MKARILAPGEGRAWIVIGDNQTVRLTGEETNGAFCLVEQTNPSGVGVPMHVHANEDEMFHIVEGEMEFEVGGEKITATAGTTVYLPRGVPHAFITRGETTKSMVMTFPSGAEKMFEELSNLPDGPPDMEKVLEICGRYGVTFL
jgi:quercetin dioxygenase-like cupin family protein